MAECVDRDELLRAIGELPLAWEYGQAVSEIYEIVKNAPTINPDDLRPRGRWIVKKEMLNMRGVLGVRCSACGQYWALVEDNAAEYMNHFKFCPNCGAKMEDGNA